MSIASLVAALAPNHALHAFDEVPADAGRRVRCQCGADLTFSPDQIATVLLFEEKQDKAHKAVRRGA